VTHRRFGGLPPAQPGTHGGDKQQKSKRRTLYGTTSQADPVFQQTVLQILFGMMVFEIDLAHHFTHINRLFAPGSLQAL
jgi:hypothetical protein